MGLELAEYRKFYSFKIVTKPGDELLMHIKCNSTSMNNLGNFNYPYACEFMDELGNIATVYSQVLLTPANCYIIRVKHLGNAYSRILFMTHLIYGTTEKMLFFDKEFKYKP